MTLLWNIYKVFSVSVTLLPTLPNSDGRLTLSKPSTNYLKRSFSYSGAMLWNTLPKSLKNAASVEHFTRNIKNAADISDSYTAIM